MNRLRRPTPHRLAVAAAATLAVLSGVLALETGALRRIEGETIDLRFQLRGPQHASDVAVVAVDDRTFSELQAQWPFRRSLHAAVIERLRRDGAKLVVYDVQFTEPTSQADDLALYEAARREGHVVFATTEVDSAGHTNVLGGDANLRRIGAVAAASNLPPERDGVIRRYSDRALGLDSLAAAAARAAGRAAPGAGSPDRAAWIDFRGPPGSIATYSFSDVLRGTVAPSRLAGRVVVVGAAAPTLQDVHQTSTATSQPMSGPEIQANAIWSALHGNPLASAPSWLALLAVVLAGLLAPLAALRVRPFLSALSAALAAAAYLVMAQIAFDAGWLLPVAYPLLALALGIVGMIAASYVVAFLERNKFSRQLRESQLELIERLAQAVEHRDAETGAHVRRIGVLCHRLALAAGWSEHDAEMLRHASAMHDVGKIGIPDAVLLKPGPLDVAEWEVVKAHTTLGGEILAQSENPLVQMAESIARCHHERWDGTGYPARLAGEQIPPGARICAICDAFDALLSQRPYKDAWSFDQAVAEVVRCRGTHFDPALVDTFVSIVSDVTGELERLEAASSRLLKLRTASA